MGQAGLINAWKNSDNKNIWLVAILYTLAVVDLDRQHWKQIRQEINKFIWNKNYAIENRVAPQRIKQNFVYTSVANGGLGMIDLNEIMVAAILKKYAHLLESGQHPIAVLQEALGAKDHLREKAILDIEDVTSDILTMLHEHHKGVYSSMTRDLAADDLITQRAIMGCRLRDIVMPVRLNSIEMTTLSRRGLRTVADVLTGAGDGMQLLKRVAYIELRVILDMLAMTYNQIPPPGILDPLYIQNVATLQWHRSELLSTKQIRQLFYAEELIMATKLLSLTREGAVALYCKISKLRNVPNRTKMLRFLHGDVYCKERMFRFGLAEDSICSRCFGVENIQHLLINCPYSVEVWGRVGIIPTEVKDVINENLSLSELEVRAEIISSLVFRKKVIPPEVLIHSIMFVFHKGLSGRKETMDYAHIW